MGISTETDRSRLPALPSNQQRGAYKAAPHGRARAVAAVGERLWEVTLNELYRVERCRDLAEEYRRISAMCTSAEMRNHYSRMSKHYSTLADAEERSAVPAA